MRDCLEKLSVLFVIGPLTLRDDLHIEVDFKSLARRAALELLHELVRHFHVLEHHLEALGELATAFFLEFEHESSLSIFANLTLLE